MLKIVFVTIFKFDKFVFQWWPHGNPAAGIGGVFVERHASGGFFIASIAGEQ